MTSPKIITVYHGCSWHSCHKYYAICELASHNGEKVASSKRSTHFITRIEKQYPIYDQNVQIDILFKTNYEGG